MHKAVRTLGLVLALGVALPASADVVLHLTNGTTLPVRAYRHEGDMMYVDLGGNGQIAFPNALVERVEDPQRSLDLKPSNLAPGQSMFGSSTPASHRGVPNPARIAASTARPVETDAHGLAVTNAVPTASSAAATRLKNIVMPDYSAARHQNATGMGNMRGAVRSGNRWVMPSDEVPVRPQGVGITPGNNARGRAPAGTAVDE
jgi:hypothetical protein